MDWLTFILHMWENHRGKIVGIVLGLIFGVCVVKYGFGRAIFVLICVLIGYYIGKKIDAKVNFRSALENLIHKDQ